MNTYLLRKQLEKGTKFAKYRAESLLGLHPLIKRAEIYIQYEKRLEADKIMIPNLEKVIGKKLGRENKSMRCAAKYQHYTSLNISWDHILQECINVEFRRKVSSIHVKATIAPKVTRFFLLLPLLPLERY